MTRSKDEIAASLLAMVGGEVRSIENAAIPVSAAVLDGIAGYGPTRSGVQINEETALTYSAVFAAIKILSESVAMLPLAVYEGDDDEDVRQRVKDHPAYPLLRYEPNPEITAVAYKEAVQANLTGWGNGYSRILFNGRDEPKELRVLPSNRTHAERYAGQLRYVVEPSGERFAPEEIIHLQGMSLNGLQGLTPIGYCRETIALGKAAEIYGASFFGNGATVDGALKFPSGMKPEQVRNVIESWNAQYSGVGNAHKTAVIPNGGSYERIGIPPGDAQFLETRRFQVEEVARIYRIPPHMLGEQERATHANIEAAGLEFLTFTLAPWLEKWEQELTRKLCGIDGRYHISFDVRRLLRTDIAARQSYYQVGSQWGFLNPDEIRAMEGLPPLPKGQGKIYRTPVNMEPMQMLQAMIAGTAARPSTNSPAPAASAPGSSPPAGNATGGGARAVQALRPVLEDAVGRMLRKESNAISRGRADAKFYSEHRQHVQAALLPVVRSMASIAGEVDPAAADAVAAAFAEVRQQQAFEPERLLPSLSGALCQQLTDAFRGQQ